MKANENIYDIPIKEIHVGKINVRMTDRKVGIDSLAESINKHGLMQPIVLKESYGTPPYELIVGQRRFLAHKKLNKKTIRAVFTGSISGEQALLLSLAENMQRVELNHADKAEAITKLYIQYKSDDRKVADELGLPLRTIRDYIKIDELATPKIKNLLRQKQISKADAKRVIDAAQGDTDKADQLIEEIPKLSKYEKDRAVEHARMHPESATNDILTAARTPRIERTIILSISQEMSKALRQAKKQLSMEAESIALMAVDEWLKKNGFMTKK